MNAGFDRLREILEAEKVDYEVVHHTKDYGARQTAAHTDTPAEEFAKTVFVWLDGKPAMAVVPADRDVALSKLRKATGAGEVSLAHEADAHELCSDCETGAAPPFGNLYGLPVYVSTSLAEDEKITFNAGTHEAAIRMAWKDFERLVKPQVVQLAKHD